MDDAPAMTPPAAGVTAQPLLRVPGLGVKAVNAILTSRRMRRLRLEDVARLTVSIAKLRPFLIASDWSPPRIHGSVDLKSVVAPKPAQMELFAA